MVKLIEELVFGKNIERTKHNHSLRGGCTNTNCSESEPAIEIDFEKVISVQKSDNTELWKEYVAVLECSACNRLYWFHISDNYAKKIKSFKNKSVSPNKV